jgi:hypothetical protein
MTERTTRAERLALPLATSAIKALTEAKGGCIRPVQLRRTDIRTGQVEQVLVPCGATLAAACPACAERAKSLRAAQCREGWHLDEEPVLEPGPPDEWQAWLLEQRAEAQQLRDHAAGEGRDTTDLDALIAELDQELAKTGIRGNPDPGKTRASRHRSTRRRQDTPDLPRRKIDPRTTGKVYTAPDGKTFRPSMFVTLTCDSYGKVTADGTPANPDSYDYQRAARDALHFAALFDRLVQNLRRFLGYDLQYFASIEPQKRLAPHVHMAMRGTVSRTELRQVIAATYHQVWWPSTGEVRFDGGRFPVWHEASGNYLDPDTGEVLTTWDQSLDAIGPDDQPLHVARFGPKFDAQGVLAGSKDSGRCIRYLTKYLTKHVADCHQADTDPQRDHAERLIDALRYEPCSPMCANWLRYGIQPKTPPKACGQEHARARHTAASTSATQAAASWCPVNGPARPSPTTAATAKPGSCPCSTSRQRTPAATPGSPSLSQMTTTCRTAGACCTCWPTAPDGRPHSPKPDEKPRRTPAIFRQQGVRHECA